LGLQKLLKSSYTKETTMVEICGRSIEVNKDAIYLMPFRGKENRIFKVGKVQLYGLVSTLAENFGQGEYGFCRDLYAVCEDYLNFPDEDKAKINLDNNLYETIKISDQVKFCKEGVQRTKDVLEQIIKAYEAKHNNATLYS